MITLVFLLVSAIIYAQPVAQFSGNKLTGCAPLTVTFTDQSTGSPFAWNWDLGNGQLSTAQNPAVTYSSPGVYTVRLVVRNTDGIDEEIKTDYIVVAASPIASFNANITTACVPATIQFNDFSTTPPGSGNITSWAWDFGDGATSNQQNPAHVYTATGFYTVSLVVTSSSGCVGGVSMGRYIRVVDGVDVNFDFSLPTTCTAPFNINFTDQSSGPGQFTYNWNFGNGAPNSNLQNPSTTYNSAGTFPVQLTVQSSLGCGGTLTKNVVISGTTTDFTFPASACLATPVSFVNSSSPVPVASSWTFGDGTSSAQINPTKTFLTPGVFDVKVVNRYGGCIDSITKSITIADSPPVDFTSNATSSCSAPFAVQFTDASAGAVTWLWDFGDGTTSTQQNPAHTYSSFGSYNVSLTISVSGGCSNTIIKNDFIKVTPTTVSIANVPAGGCIPFTFSPSTTIATVDPVVSYAWDFGEPGATYTTPNPTHTYSTAGTYTLTLTVTTQSGCTASTSTTVRTGIPPVVDFSFAPVNACSSETIQFNDLSTVTAGGEIKWSWDFGDGAGSALQNPAHNYNKTGPMTVNLSVSNNGCAASASHSLQVLPPVADFGYLVDCAFPTRVTFSDSSQTDVAYGAIQYHWLPGDAGGQVIDFTPPAAPSFDYGQYGTFNSTLIVTNGTCADTVIRQIILPDLSPDFTASKSPVCRNEPFTLTSANSNASQIRSYRWTINGITSPDTTATITVLMPANGTFDVTLTTIDINGCVKTKTVPGFLQVTGPQASFTSGAGACISKPVTFTDLSTPAASIQHWDWDFGDGQQRSFTAAPFTHLYADEGSYTVTLKVTDNNGCSDVSSAVTPILITNPRADFKADTIYCPETPLQFTDLSTGNNLNYSWNFGDGGTDAVRDPLHSFPAGDNQYSVQLHITDLAGCEDSITKNAYIRIRKPKAAFEILDSAGICLPLQTSFTFKGSDYQSFYWDFGDGGSSTLKDARHFYNSYGTYTPKLYLTGPGGCVDSASATVHAYDPSSIIINASPIEACNTITSTFNFTPPPGFRYTFYFGDGTLDTTQSTSLTHTYLSPGNYGQYLLFTEKSGCQATSASSAVTVHGTIPLFGKNRKEFCDNGQVFFSNFTVTNETVLSSVWDFGDGTSSTDRDPVHTFTAPGTYIVSLNTITQSQCASTFTDTVRVYRTPVISISSKDTICINNTENFIGSLAQADTAMKWNWNFGNGSSSTTQNSSMSYNTAGNYTVQLIAANKIGCSDTAAKTIAVSPLPTAIAAMDPITIISGASASLNMNYTGPIQQYSWLPSVNLSCDDCAVPVATPRSTTSYRVQVTDRFGCINTGNVTVRVVCSNENFFIPNTFSPNGDGSNDRFYPRGTGLYSVKTLRIFNRWGEMVFEKRDFPMNDASQGWDGMYKGRKAPADVYVYQAEIFCNNGELVKYAGNVALIL